MKDSLPRSAMIAIIGSVSVLPLLILPVMVGSYVDELGLSESQAGWLASAWFLGAATCALVLAFRIHHLELRRLAWLGLLMMAVADGVSISAASLPMTVLIFLRFASGVASAVVYGAVMSAYASFREPDRAYGLFMAVQFAVSAAGLYLLPGWVPETGVAGVFSLLTMANVFALLFINHIPDRAERQSHADLAVIEWKVILTVTAMAVVLGIGLFEAANLAQFTYIERIGVAAGLEPEHIGFALGTATLLGIPAAFSVTLIGDRFGHFWPIALACAIEMIGLAWLMTGPGFTGYLLSASLLGLGWAMALPYFQAIGADLDKGGSVVVACGFATGAGGFVGPAGAAMLVSSGHYNVMLGSVLACFVVITVLTAFVTRRLSMAVESG